MACYCGDCASHQPPWRESQPAQPKVVDTYTPPAPKVETRKVEYAVRSDPAGVATAIRSILKEAAKAGATVDWDTATSESTYNPIDMTEHVLLKVDAYYKPMTILGDKQEWIED